MKPIWKNGSLSVELHKADCKSLGKAREIGLALDAMNQETGQPLVQAIDAILMEDAHTGSPASPIANTTTASDVADADDE